MPQATVRPRLVSFFFLGCALVGCGGEQSAPADSGSGREVEFRSQQIRPTDGDGWNGNGFGIPAEVYDLPGGHFRVFYVTSSENAVDLADVDPKDGVPDFPQLVGALAESTYKSTIAERGFRPPLDDSVYHDRPDFGGDGRYDIYLRGSGKSSDGYRVSEVCTDGSDGGSAGRCAGYFVMNPSFKGTSYPSERAAVEVLVSHELFHSIQDSYNAGQWRTWTEATAVWNELQVFPKSAGTFADYLGFLPAFFNEPERPFDKSMGSGPAAAYAYGTAAWPVFLSEKFGPEIIRSIWERCEQPPTGDAPNFLDATDAVLRASYASSLAAAWTEFTRWNLLTGERAIPGQGYGRAAEYPGVRFEPELPGLGQMASVELNGLSARYLRLRPGLTAPARVQVEFSDPASAQPAPVVAAFIVPAQGAAPQAAGELTAGRFERTLNPGESLLFVLTGAVRGARTRTLQITSNIVTEQQPDPPDNKDDPAAATGCSLSSAPAPTSPRDLAAVLLLATGLALTVRRQATRRSLYAQ